ncbi:hypothetical protein F3Y22_tig00111834pilonHSYRG00008 [Hibiscus syriacus]|uniref:Uncharacterized protein n=1 Tax=Hibiscus syriacus TaxID=106335 RepID=A0A6A2Y7R2_HIBSY|nr:hypothetical protein F3Y22_tig00111834pilonHSYRG00008 [Hibiscus syriacus]
MVLSCFPIQVPYYTVDHFTRHFICFHEDVEAPGFWNLVLSEGLEKSTRPIIGSFIFRREGDNQYIINDELPSWKAGYLLSVMIFRLLFPLCCLISVTVHEEKFVQFYDRQICTNTPNLTQSYKQHHQISDGFRWEIGFFRRDNQTDQWSLDWSEPADECSVFDACGKSGTATTKLGTLQVFTGLQATVTGELESGRLFRRVHKKISCMRRYSNEFLNLSMIMNHMQMVDLHLSVPISEMGNRTCGTNIIPYPLSTRSNCGDLKYFKFDCQTENDTGLISFNANGRTLEPTESVESIRRHEACLATKDNFSIDSLGNDKWFYEVKIEWSPPIEPIGSSKDYKDWPDSSCNVAPDGKNRCTCNSPSIWDPSEPVALESGFYLEPTPCQWTFGEKEATISDLPRCHHGYAVHLVRRFRLERSDEEETNAQSTRKSGTQLVQQYTVSVWKAMIATDNFAEANKLGQGGFGLFTRVPFHEDKNRHKEALEMFRPRLRGIQERSFDRQAPAPKSCQTSRLLGYLSPEYALDGFFSIKSDVFSFGVVLLETISGKRNTRFYQAEQPLSLLGYAWRLWKEGRAFDLAEQSFWEACDENEYIRTPSLPIPEQPAFVVRRSLPGSASSSSQQQRNAELSTGTLEKTEGKDFTMLDQDDGYDHYVRVSLSWAGLQPTQIRFRQ